MKYKNALVLWNEGTDQITVVPLGHPTARIPFGQPGHYRCSGGAAYLEVHTCNNSWKNKAWMLHEFIQITQVGNVSFVAAHKAFMEIDEFREWNWPNPVTYRYPREEE
jgi:hypothetical protein